MSDLLDIAQAADRLGISKSLARRYCREGRLGTKIGSRWIITSAQLTEFAQTPRPRGRPHKASTMDRTEQVDWLREMAESIATNGHNPVDGVSAEALVAFAVDENGWGIDWPDWFDRHDRALLTRFVSEALG